MEGERNEKLRLNVAKRKERKNERWKWQVKIEQTGERKKQNGTRMGEEGKINNREKGEIETRD